MRFISPMVFERWQKKLSNMRYTAVPHISQLPRKSLILVGICVSRWPSFKSTKSSKILTLAQNIGPFNADVNLKYERCNFNSYLEKIKRDTPVEVELCRTSTGVTHSWHISWLGVVILPCLRCHGPIKSVSGHTGLVPPFSQFSRSVLLVHSKETNIMSNKSLFVK
jgi:hypothetical protein